MKSLILALFVIVIPAFSSTTSCPQGGPLSSVVGCQTFDSMLTSVSIAPLPASADDVPTVSVMPATSSFSELLVSPAQVSVSPVADTIPLSIPSSTDIFPAPSISQDIFIPPSSSFESLPTSTFTSGLSSSLVMGQVPLASVVLPSQFNVGLPVGVGLDPIGDALGAPEASSVAMIGSGLIFLSLVSTAVRKRKRRS
jgi:hypothetical protein